MKNSLVPLIFIFPIFGFFFTDLKNGSSRYSPQNPSRMINLVAEDVSGRKISLGYAHSTNGRPRQGLKIINIWASWCGPCLAEHPWVNRLGERGDVDLIGVAYHDSSDAVQNFLNQHGNPYHQLAFDPRGELMIEFGARGVPQTYVLNAENQIIWSQVGALNRQSYNALTRFLDDQPTEIAKNFAKQNKNNS